MAFAMWSLVSVLMFISGIVTMNMKKPAGFFANSPAPETVTDTKAYNRSLGKLWIVYGILLCLCGLPLLNPKPGALIIVTMLGTVFSSLGMIVVYVGFIAPKYKA